MNASVTNNNIPAIISALPNVLSAVLRKSAFDVERAAKDAAPVDTGALRASIYVSISGDSDYAEKSAEAQSLMAGKTDKERKEVGILPEVKSDDELTAVVAVAAAHGAYVEYGTARKGARPFLNPAMDHVRSSFLAAVRQAIEKAAR